MNHPQQPPRGQGFTLVETLATLTVASVLVTLGIPGMDQLMASHQQKSALYSLFAHAQMARSVAITQGRRAVLCASDEGAACDDSAQWNGGYILFVDHNGNRTRDADEPLLARQTGYSRVRLGTTSGRKTLTYQSNGMSGGSNLTFTFCDAKNRVPPKALIVSNTGRPRIADRRSDGSPLNCG